MFDRSSEFFRLAKSTKTRTSSNISLKTAGEGDLPPVPIDIESAISKTVLIDEFFNQIELLNNSIERITVFMGEVENLHKSALVTVEVDDSNRIAKRIEVTSVLASNEALIVRRLLKSMDEDLKKSTSSSDVSETDLRLRRVKLQSYCKKFLNLMEQFEEMQKIYRNKYRQSLERQYLLINPNATREEMEQIHSNTTEAMTQQIFSLANKARIQQTLNEFKGRQAEIQKIEKNMAELHEMFLDISFIVSQQGYTIGKVDEYVQSSAEATEQAAQAMDQAVVSQKKAQRRRWFFSGLGISVLIVLIVIIVLALTKRI